MGSTYANVVVVGADEESVVAALAGTVGFVAGGDGVVVAFTEFDESDGMGSGATAARLSATLGCPAIEAMVFDEDILQLQVFIDGQLRAAAVAPPSAVGLMEEMGDMAELADLDSDAGWPQESAPDGSVIVEALGQGDGEALAAALAAEQVFATESHAAVWKALGLPAWSVSWGYRYLAQGGDGFEGPPLRTI